MLRRYEAPGAPQKAAYLLSMVFDTNQFKPPGTDNNKNGKPSLANMQYPPLSLRTILRYGFTH